MSNTQCLEMFAIIISVLSIVVSGAACINLDRAHRRMKEYNEEVKKINEAFDAVNPLRNRDES